MAVYSPTLHAQESGSSLEWDFRDFGEVHSYIHLWQLKMTPPWLLFLYLKCQHTAP